MNGDSSTTRVVVLTDGKQSKPVKLKTDSCTVSSVRTEAKNKLRKKYNFIVCQNDASGRTPGLLISTDDELRQVLERDDGPIKLFFTNTEPTINAESFDEKGDRSAAVASHGISFVIGDADTTEDEALSQLKKSSELQGCVFAIGMPDLHPGKGIPIGAAIVTDETIAYPQLVDNDIGCGMSFVETSLKAGKLSTKKVHNIAKSLTSIDGPYADVGALTELCAQSTEWGARKLDPLPVLEPSYHYENLGTIGGGNHFAELQEFEKIYDSDAIEHYGIDATRVHLLVHSGSRSLGAQYLKQFCESIDEERKAGDGLRKHGHYAVDTSSLLFKEYIQNHDVALNFAARNRQLIAKRLLEQICGDTQPACKIDVHHNFLEQIQFDSLEALREMAEHSPFPKEIAPIKASAKSSVGWIHRKGATPNTHSPILVIPGSRGSLSYLVEVNRDAAHGSGYSLAHGAGRAMNRSTALKLHKRTYANAKQLLQTSHGGVVVCEKKDLLYEEHPGAYKEIDRVVECLCGAQLVRILATLRPLLTYKYKNPHMPK